MVFLAGMELTLDKVKEYEQVLAANPDAADYRVCLLGYYSHARLLRRKGASKDKAHQEFFCHLKWIIKNTPNNEDLRMVSLLEKGEPGYREVRALLDEAINENPNDVGVLINAAWFYRFWSFTITETLWKHILELEPNNHEWHSDFSKLYMYRASDKTSSSHKRYAKKAMKHFQIALQLFLEGSKEKYWQYSDSDFNELLRTAKRFKLQNDVEWLSKAKGWKEMTDWSNEIPKWSKRHWEVLDFNAGQGLNSSEMKNLERKLEERPDDLETRILLLGFYDGARHNLSKKDKKIEAHEKFLCHLKWLIVNHPDHKDLGHATLLMKNETGFDEIKNLWDKAIDKNLRNKSVLHNAIGFFRMEDFSKAENLWAELFELDPNNVDFHLELSDACESQANLSDDSIEKKRMVNKAIEQIYVISISQDFGAKFKFLTFCLEDQ